MPAVGLETFAHILLEGDVGIAFDGDMIVVVEVNNIPKAKMPRNRRRFATDPLHHIPITADSIDHVIIKFKTRLVESCRQMFLRYRKPDAVGETLAQRTRRHFDARRQAIFGMPGRLAMQLSEIFDVLEGKIIPGEIKKT